MDSYTVLLSALNKRKLKDHEWQTTNDDGWSIAHQYASHFKLPNNFQYLTLADQEGWTVAHVAASYGHLPDDFQLWTLADKFGVTVAHVAARHCHVSRQMYSANVAKAVDANGRSVWDEIKKTAKHRCQEALEMLKK